ncbi:MAG: [LysW]-lysine hydrolase [Chloroflexota bacterium]
MNLGPVTFLEQLVAIPSVSGQEQEAVSFLVAQMSALGMDAHVDEAGNAVGVRAGENGQNAETRDIVLLGHVDTVPGQLVVHREAGRLYGRGAVDAKGALASFVIAAAQTSLPPDTRLVVIGAVEEESATSKGAYHAVTQYRPAACIIGEPSGWNAVTVGYKGRLLLDYHRQQPMGHSAGPQTGVAERGIDWWNALLAQAETYNQGRERLFDRLLPSLREINTGSDGLSNNVRIRVGLRLPPAFDADSFVSMARSLAGDATVIDHGYEPAYVAEPRSPLTRAFNQALRRRNQRPRHLLKTGTSDMNVVGPRWNCPILAYGPGDSSLDHTPEEHIVVEEYLRAIQILMDVLARIGKNGLQQ